MYYPHGIAILLLLLLCCAHSVITDIKQNVSFAQNSEFNQKALLTAFLGLLHTNFTNLKTASECVWNEAAYFWKSSVDQFQIIGQVILILFKPLWSSFMQFIGHKREKNGIYLN